MGKLTALAVKSAKLPGRYGDGDGLMLFVKPNGGKSWILRTQHNGKRSDIGLGSARDTTLAEARQKAAEARLLIRQGLDPKKSTKSLLGIPRAFVTFAEAAREAHVDLSAGWKNRKHGDQWLSSLESHAFPSLANINVRDIDAAAIIRAVRPIWLTHEETARRVRQRICAVLDWAQGHGFRELDCPKGAISKGLPRQKNRKSHHAAVAFPDAPSLFLRMSPEKYVGLSALKFLILTAARSAEVRLASWSEIDFGEKVWRIPAGRMKGGREHVVPLGHTALEILQHVQSLRQSLNEQELLFPSANGRALSDATMMKALRTHGTDATVHGFRSTFRDWVAERTSYGDAVAEAALAHANRNRVEAAYRRTNFLHVRKKLMQDWDDFLRGIEKADATHS